MLLNSATDYYLGMYIVECWIKIILCFQ